MLKDIKLSKGQISKMIQLGGFFGSWKETWKYLNCIEHVLSYYV